MSSISSPFHRWRNPGSKRLSNLSKFTLLLCANSQDSNSVLPHLSCYTIHVWKKESEYIILSALKLKFIANIDPDFYSWNWNKNQYVVLKGSCNGNVLRGLGSNWLGLNPRWIQWINGRWHYPRTALSTILSTYQF